MFRKLFVVGALAVLAANSSIARAQTPTDCSGYPSQAAAQAALRANPSDPNNLDPDDDGIACENNPGPYDRTPVNRQAGVTTTTAAGNLTTTSTTPPTTTVGPATNQMANSGPRDAIGMVSLLGVVALAGGFALRGRRATGGHWLQ